MVDWLTWPAELVLNAGGIVASWFVSRDSLGFVALQMGFALVVLAAIVSLFAYLPALRIHELIALASSTLFSTSIKDADCDLVVGL
jgi:hypothetical protein